MAPTGSAAWHGLRRDRGEVNAGEHTHTKLQRDPHLVARLLGTPASCRAGAGALEQLARQLQHDAVELEDFLAARAAAGTP